MNANSHIEKYRDLRSRLEASPEEFSETVELADATLNVLNESLDIFDGAIAPDPDSALLRYKELRDLAQAYPSNEVVTYKYFVGGGNLIGSLIIGSPKQQEHALRLYKELNSFLHACTECQRPRSHFAAISSSLVKRIGNEKFDLTYEIYQGIKELNDQNPSDDWIASCQAGAALSLIYLHRKYSFEAATDFYRDLHVLSGRYSHVDAIVGDHCSAACTLLERCSETNPIDARNYYSDIQKLVDLRPDIIELKLTQLEMCCRFIITGIAVDELSVGSQIFADSENIALEICDRTDVRSCFALTAFLWLQKLSEYDPNSAKTVLAKLVALGNSYPEDADIADFVRHSRELIGE